MKQIKSLCPRCKSPQNFTPQKIQVGPDEFEIQIRCKVCRWFKVTIRGNSAMIDNYRQITRLKQRATRDPGLERVLKRKLEKQRELLDTRQSNSETA
jgi:hypothetical protein